MNDSRTHVAIGAIVSVALLGLPGGPLLGGGLAGYLEGASERHGARVGVLAGIAALLIAVVVNVGTSLSDLLGDQIVDVVFLGVLDPAFQYVRGELRGTPQTWHQMTEVNTLISRMLG